VHRYWQAVAAAAAAAAYKAAKINGRRRVVPGTTWTTN